MKASPAPTPQRQLLIDPTLLSIINGGTTTLETLRIGGFTDVTGATVTGPAASASGITIDGPVDLTDTAFALDLLANGPITEPGGPLTVTQVSGSSIGAFSLANPANAIAETAGITATNGDVVVVSQTDLELLGAHNGNNLFFEVAGAGGALTIGNGNSAVSLNAATGGRISLVADQITDPSERRHDIRPGRYPRAGAVLRDQHERERHARRRATADRWDAAVRRDPRPQHAGDRWVHQRAGRGDHVHAFRRQRDDRRRIRPRATCDDTQSRGDRIGHPGGTHPERRHAARHHRIHDADQPGQHRRHAGQLRGHQRTGLHRRHRSADRADR